MTNQRAGVSDMERMARDRALVAAIMGRASWEDATDYRNTGAQDREVERLMSLVRAYRAHLLENDDG